MDSILKKPPLSDNENWSMIIRPKRNLLDLRLAICGGRVTWSCCLSGGICLGLQANHPGPALVYHPAAPDYRYLYVHIWQRGEITHGRPAAIPVLYVRHGGLDLFFHQPDQDFGYFHP